MPEAGAPGMGAEKQFRSKIARKVPTFMRAHIAQEYSNLLTGWVALHIRKLTLMSSPRAHLPYVGVTDGGYLREPR